MCPNCDKKFSFKKASMFLFIVTAAIFSLETMASGTKGQMNHGKKIDVTNTDKMKVSDKEKGIILSALAAYDELHFAYFEYDKNEVVNKAQILSQKLDLIETKMIRAKFEKDNIQKLISAIKAKNSTSINNSLLDNISKRLNDIIISKVDLGGRYGIYYCPMVKKYWLQNIKKMSKVHNPYAPEMPHCGSAK
jgi:uncharacterized membrane protein